MRRKRCQLSDRERGRIVGLGEAGSLNRRIGHYLDRRGMVVVPCGNSGSLKGESTVTKDQDFLLTQMRERMVQS